MAVKLQLSRLTRAFDQGAMGLDVLLQDIVGEDVELVVDAGDAHDAVGWLLRAGARSVAYPRNSKVRWSCWISAELWADKPALEACMLSGIDRWAAERGFEPDGPLLGIHELHRRQRDGVVMIEAVALRRFRLADVAIG